MLCGLPATFRSVVAHTAWLEPSKATELQPVIGDAPSRKVTLPFAPGSPATAATVAVKVTVSPYVVVLRSEIRLVVVIRDRWSV